MRIRFLYCCSTPGHNRMTFAPDYINVKPASKSSRRLFPPCSAGSRLRLKGEEAWVLHTPEQQVEDAEVREGFVGADILTRHPILRLKHEQEKTGWVIISFCWNSEWQIPARLTSLYYHFIWHPENVCLAASTATHWRTHKISKFGFNYSNRGIFTVSFSSGGPISLDLFPFF